MKARWNRAARRAAVAFVAACGTCAPGELALRAAPGLAIGVRPPLYPGELPDRPNRAFVGDERLGWRIRPGHTFHWTVEGERDAYSGDAAGFRVDPEAPARTATAPRIVLVGDSFALGVGVEYRETFGALLEARLGDTRVRNLAMPGYGLDQIWMCVRHHALALEPSLVIVTFVDNDLDRCLTAYRRVEGFNEPIFVIEGDALRRQTAADRPGPLERALQGSRLAGVWRSWERKLGRRWPLGTYWRRNAAILRALRDDCRDAGVPLLVVRLPLPRGAAFPRLAVWLAELGVSYLDLGTDVPEGLHFERDRHIHEAGHRWVAERIAAAVERELPPARGAAAGAGAR